MKQMLLQITVLASLLLVPLMSMPGTALAASCPGGNTAEGQVLEGVGQTGSGCSETGVPRVVQAVVRILSYVVGVAAIIMIIIAGFKYVTSNGDSGKITSAKNTLIYALVGIAVAALARILVSFVLNQTAKV